jgi:tetratricopeptide (TPR) repeat protein
MAAPPTGSAISAAGATGAASTAAVARDDWLEKAQEYAESCRCYARLLSHSLDWTRAERERAEAWSYLGLAQQREYHVDEARAAHAEALRLGPRNYLVLVQAAYFHFTRAESVEAAKYYKQATEVNPSLVSAWTGLGSAYSMMPDHPASIDAFQHAVAISPRDASLLHALGDEYYHSNRFADAVATYEKALALDPGNDRLKTALARAKQR